MTHSATQAHSVGGATDMHSCTCTAQKSTNHFPLSQHYFTEKQQQPERSSTSGKNDENKTESKTMSKCTPCCNCEVQHVG